MVSKNILRNMNFIYSNGGVCSAKFPIEYRHFRSVYTDAIVYFRDITRHMIYIIMFAQTIIQSSPMCG